MIFGDQVIVFPHRHIKSKKNPVAEEKDCGKGQENIGKKFAHGKEEKPMQKKQKSKKASEKIEESIGKNRPSQPSGGGDARYTLK